MHARTCTYMCDLICYIVELYLHVTIKEEEVFINWVYSFIFYGLGYFCFSQGVNSIRGHESTSSSLDMF